MQHAMQFCFRSGALADSDASLKLMVSFAAKRADMSALIHPPNGKFDQHTELDMHLLAGDWPIDRT